MTEQPKWTSKVKASRVKEARDRRRKRRVREAQDTARDAALLAVAENRSPRVRDCADLDTRMVINPAEGENLLYVDRGAPVRFVNPEARARPHVVSLRDDPIGKMAQLGRLGFNEDRDVRLLAARKWQENYDLAAGQRGLDMSGDVVDGGRVDDIAEARLTAIKTLGRASQILGMRNENLVYQLLGEGHTLEEFLAKAGMLDGSATRRQKIIDAYVQVLRDCLDDLAVLFRFRVTGKGPHRVHDRFDVLAGVTKFPRLYDAMNRSPPLLEAVRRAKSST